MKALLPFSRHLTSLVMVSLALWGGCGNDSGPTSSNDPVPAVHLTYPSPGQVCAGIVMLMATAEHADRVKFYAGSTLIGTDSAPPYETTWNTATVANGSHTIRAKAEGPGGSAEDERTVAVNNQAGVVVNLSPGAVSVEVGGSQQFTALVSGTTNLGVTWSVDEGSDRGTITPAGLYTAPAVVPSPPTATVRATSIADPTRIGTAVVTITQAQAVTISVSPPTTTLSPGQTQQFTAQVSGTANPAVVWTVVEGTAHGTISAAGLYAAPSVVPSPPSATVRATSLADPSKSATAQVTLTGDAGSDKELAARLFNLGSDCNEISDLILNSVTWGVWMASRIAGGSSVVSTGTLTETGPQDDDWAYAPAPNDRFIIHYQNGLEEEIRFSGGMAIQITSWPTDAFNSHQLTFTYRISGVADFTVQSVSQYTLAAPAPQGAASPQDYTREFTCSINGTLALQGTTWTWNVSRSGRDRYEVDSNWAYRNSTNDYSGTVGTPSTTFTLNASDFFIYTYINSTHVVNRGITSRSAANRGGISYQYEDAFVRWAAGAVYGGGYDATRINSVIDPGYWTATGRLRKGAAILGTLAFSIQPQDGQIFGPDLLLSMAGGETALLHTLISN